MSALVGAAAGQRMRVSVHDPAVTSARAALVASDLLVTLDLAVRRTSGPADRLRSQHGVRRDRVTCCSTAFTGIVEIGRLPLGAWPDELARVATVAGDARSVGHPAAGLVLPWDLLVGTASARAHGRSDVYDVLTAREAEGCRVDGRPLDLTTCRRQLEILHAAAGRLRMVGAVPRASASRARPGWVSWLLFDAGWCALVPHLGAGRRPLVSVEPRRPDELSRDTAAWLSGSRR